MNILFITDRYPPDTGGAANSAERISRILSQEGNSVHILQLTTSLNPGEIISATDNYGRIIHKTGLFNEFDTAMQWIEMIINGLNKKVGFSVIHGHGLFPAGFLAAYCAKFNNIKSLSSIRGNDLDRGIHRGDIFQHLLWTLQNSDVISAVSNEAIHKSISLAGNDAKFIYTPNGVNTDIFKPASKTIKLMEEYNISDELIFLFTGEMRFKKGQPFIFDAFQEINKNIKCKLIIAGEMRNNVDKENFLLKLPKLRNDIIFIPYITDEHKLAEVYNLCHFFLSPSLWDGMPNSVLEAMACGKIVIGTTVGGMPDIIQHGKNGILISPDDLPRLGEALTEALQIPQEVINQMSINARNCILNGFTLEHEKQTWINIYNRLTP